MESVRKGPSFKKMDKYNICSIKWIRRWTIINQRSQDRRHEQKPEVYSCFEKENRPGPFILLMAPVVILMTKQFGDMSLTKKRCWIWGYYKLNINVGLNDIYIYILMANQAMLVSVERLKRWRHFVINFWLCISFVRYNCQMRQLSTRDQWHRSE